MLPFWGVCFKALVNKLLKILSNLSLSSHVKKELSKPEYSTFILFCIALTRKVSTQLAISSTISYWPTCIFKASFSNLLKSSIWSISLSIWLILRDIMLSIWWFCIDKLLSHFMVVTGPRIIVNGFLNSCEILAKKSMFIWLVVCSRSLSRWSIRIAIRSDLIWRYNRLM